MRLESHSSRFTGGLSDGDAWLRIGGQAKQSHSLMIWCGAPLSASFRDHDLLMLLPIETKQSELRGTISSITQGLYGLEGRTNQSLVFSLSVIER